MGRALVVDEGQQVFGAVADGGVGREGKARVQAAVGR